LCQGEYDALENGSLFKTISILLDDRKWAVLVSVDGKRARQDVSICKGEQAKTAGKEKQRKGFSKKKKGEVGEKI